MIYNVFLNSNSRSSGTVLNANYFFDWSILPSSSYKVSFNFVSSSINTSVLNNIANLDINLGQAMTFQTSSTQTRATSTNQVGFLLSNETSTNTYLFGDSSTLPIIFLNSKPTSNDFTVRILNNALIPLEWTDSVGGLPTEYVLIISLESV